MQDTGVLAQLLQESTVTTRFGRLAAIEKKLDDVDPVRRLAALIAGAEHRRRISDVAAARWRLSADDSGERLAALVGTPEPLKPDLDLPAQDRLLYRHGRDLFRDLVLLAWATEMKGESEAIWRAMLERAKEWEAPTFPVTGADVLARASRQGPEVGRLLRDRRGLVDRARLPTLRTARLTARDKLDALIAAPPRE